ncbi:uncharacterized protein OCT59_004016 [Rhizophagus irregularis]|uniref:Calponin-homology (CH) domain-containing protein n=2 Tax=Rhizophagus irregularis TaxID=588596 RepID=A0A015L8R8_RHIIW|nr:hypothetical protein GLOIN_2v1622940 [Rhizophagus irregularis DAOM 181602=DAOM 197198]EXX68936.1 hypothetical protein RirG_100540 [Rhizophagus irregularis DAOM 197198w]POG69790.1 hypothetical protein GLOIN_2v1622940 [Rhizophagus irregularis DAOM 181602=DAOM 197198]UZO12482.1 hypothetical protein OCT59_004016 [Rhizophagus irregularis]GBC53387.1 alpha-actinin, sarcomeric-like [Rhizophagus irregularis DAOM 181602=DAOM 197198]|eukprot:XP_025176656.1 hypothetical protein GLOIN_2v1622940 [Rhizophagus irregularis DAOM 181602=DAOM 197198]
MSQPSSPISPTKPKRRNSLKEQWDTTTKVVNVKQKFHSYVVDKYTELQKATFTKWVNIQLRMIDINQLNSNKKIPEIKSIDKDFRDGKKLIQLLEILYPNDPELPKIERGKTRHHHIANVNNVLEFLKKRLDEKSLIALEAIGAVDIVDGNVKLTLGLIWLTTSKFLNMFSVQFEVTEEELEQVEERFKESIKYKKENNNKYNDIQKFLFHNDDDLSFEQFQQQFRSHFVEEELLDVPNTIIEEEVDIETLLHDDHSEQKTFTEDNLENSSTSSQNNKTSQPLPSQIKVTIPSLPTPMANKRLQDLSKSEKRLSLPIFQTNNNNNLTINPTKISSSNSKPFRTLRLNSSPINSNTSNLLFWINMQLINYSSLLPSSNYPLEDFIGLNDGIVLSALIQYLNIEWKMDDLNLLDPDDIKNDKDEFCEEIKTKERLSKCFDIIEKKLNVRQPKALISMLIEKDYNDKERLKRTGLAWSVYISEIFLAITKSKNQRKEMKRQNRLSMLNNIEENKEEEEKKGKSKEHVVRIIDYDAIHYQSPSNDRHKKHKKSRGCLPFYTSNDEDSFWTPSAASLIVMIWEWTLHWLLTDDDDDDDDDDDSDTDLFFEV